jgi:hypothetical protein
LQKAGKKLNQTITEHGLIISVEKIKLTSFKRAEAVRNKSVINKKNYSISKFL